MSNSHLPVPSPRRAPTEAGHRYHRSARPPLRGRPLGRHPGRRVPREPADPRRVRRARPRRSARSSERSTRCSASRGRTSAAPCGSGPRPSSSPSTRRASPRRSERSVSGIATPRVRARRAGDRLAPRGCRRGAPAAARGHRLLPRLQALLPALVRACRVRAPGSLGAPCLGTQRGSPAGAQAGRRRGPPLTGDPLARDGARLSARC